LLDGPHVVSRFILLRRYKNEAKRLWLDARIAS
jgi:hypothetical protein